MRLKEKQPTFCIATLGCKVNQTDTQLMERILKAEGYRPVSFQQGADLYIINTCTVTARSDYTSRQLARRAIRQNNQAKVIVTGCYAQTDPQKLARIPGVNLVLNNQEKSNIGSYLPHLFKNSVSPPKSCSPLPRPDNHYTRAFLKIQDGCDWACTYCIVPQARGKSASRPAAEIIRDCKQLAAQGYKEIVLTGIHVGRYGSDLSPESSLARLLAELCALEGLPRIRLSSLEPTEFSPQLLEVIKENDKICPHFHIPLQSADDNILQAMGRNYRFAEYQQLLWRLREEFPRAALGADVIVGFPGEDEASFQLGCERIARLPLTYLHVFSYSKRPGTRAAQFPQQVSARQKKSRSLELRKLGEQKKLSFYQDQLGQTRTGVILNQRQNNYLVGLSDNYIKILVEGGDDLINRLVPIKITDIVDSQIFGQIKGPGN